MYTVSVLLFTLLAQHIGVHGGHGSGSTTPASVGPSIVLLSPTSTPFETSAVTQVIAGTASAGTAALSSVTVVCSGATTLSYTATGTTSWSDIKTLNTGTTSCVATVTDTSARTAARSFAFVVINPDAGAPTLNAGADASTTSASLPRSVTCTDDVGCTSVSWSGAGGSGVCDPSSSNAPTGSYDCTFLLATTGTCGATRVNTITVTAADLSGNIATDTVDITRTAALAITTTSGGRFFSLQAGTTLTLSGSGGASCSYTWGNNSGGTTLKDSDADCAGLSISSAGVVSGTATQTSGLPATCSWTASLGDGSTTVTTPLTTLVDDASATTYFQQITALTDGGGAHYVQPIDGCANAFNGTVSGGDPYGCSLQNAAELNNVRQAGGTQAYTYDATENAAKLTWLQTTASPASTLRMPIHSTSGTWLFIWDFKPTVTWGINGTLGGSSCGGNVDPTRANYDHKEFQIAMSPTGETSGSITDEVKTSFTQGSAPFATTCADIGVYSTRWYPQAPNSYSDMGILGSPPNPVETADGTAGAGTVQAQAYPFKHSVWTRYWMEVRLNQPESAFTSWTATYPTKTVPTGTYHMVSLWVADENRAPVRLIYKAPMQRGLTSQSGTITSLTHSGATATVTGSSTLIGKFSVGDPIYISGASPSVYNSATSGDFTVASVGATTLTFTLPSTPASDATGTITMTKVRDGIAMVWFEHNTSDNLDRASGTITVSGVDGTVIPKGTSVTSPTSLVFKTQTASYTIAGGSVQIPIQAQDTSSGPQGNLDAGTVMTISGISGITSVVIGPGNLTGGNYITAGDLIAYARWFLPLKNYTFSDPATPENDTTIFQKPR